MLSNELYFAQKVIDYTLYPPTDSKLFIKFSSIFCNTFRNYSKNRETFSALKIRVY